MKCCQAPSGYGELFSPAQLAGRRSASGERGSTGRRAGSSRPCRNRGSRAGACSSRAAAIGAVEIELLKAGAARSTVVELSPGYEEVAAELAREAGVAERIERHIGDFVADGTEPADVVVLHRVVCCYPDYEVLLGAAAGKARQTVVFTYPPRNVVSRSLLWPREPLAARQRHGLPVVRASTRADG